MVSGQMKEHQDANYEVEKKISRDQNGNLDLVGSINNKPKEVPSPSKYMPMTVNPGDVNPQSQMQEHTPKVFSPAFKKGSFDPSTTKRKWEQKSIGGDSGRYEEGIALFQGNTTTLNTKNSHRSLVLQTGDES